jgi:hypothetical protein
MQTDITLRHRLKQTESEGVKCTKHETFRRMFSPGFLSLNGRNLCHIR